MDLFFPRRGTSREAISRCQVENIANQKPFLRQAKPWAEALLARCLELETNPGRIRRSHVAGSQQGPKGLQKSLRPKTMDFFQDMGFLNPVSLKVTVHSVALTLKKKEAKKETHTEMPRETIWQSSKRRERRPGPVAHVYNLRKLKQED